MSCRPTVLSWHQREQLRARATRMRHAPTASEQLLWRHLRNRQLGVEFRRQVPLLGRYVVDFYASSVRVVVEVDGGYHGDRARADARRDGALEHAGDRVLRLSEELVTRQLEVALARIAAAIRPG